MSEFTDGIGGGGGSVTTLESSDGTKDNVGAIFTDTAFKFIGTYSRSCVSLGFTVFCKLRCSNLLINLFIFFKKLVSPLFFG
nr:hypothetical protein [Providencia stuartii]ELR5083087.1 hypothetical protein [Providencia stuartii]ELR5084628.1 hypothetical protein [Providencia stuartii]